MMTDRSTQRRSVWGQMCGEEGVALIITLLSTSLMLALVVALLLTTMTEMKIAAGYRQQAVTHYAAEAGLDLVVQTLSAIPDWDGIVSGVSTSTFTDGPPSGIRVLPGGTEIDLTTVTHTMRCGQPACRGTDVTAVTSARPWGSNNPVWQLYAYGPLNRMLPAGAIDSHMYLMVWVADDPSENDNDPFRDGGVPAGCDRTRAPSCVDDNPGRGVIAIVARAVGPNAAQHTIEATIRRSDRSRIVSWREVR